MKKKKLALISSAAILSLALAGTIGVISASADTLNQDTPDHNGTTTVKYSVADSWTVTIPEEIIINGVNTGDVTAKDVVIEKGTNLNVTVHSANNFKVKGTVKTENEYAYQLKKDGSVLTQDGNVLTVAAGSEEAAKEADGVSATLTAELNDAEAGKYSTGTDTYEDTLTFTVDDGATGD